MVVTDRPCLIDKSALVRLGECHEQELWARRIQRGLVHVTTITLLEAGYPARSAEDMGELLDLPPLSLMPVEYLPRRRKNARSRCCEASLTADSTAPRPSQTS